MYILAKTSTKTDPTDATWIVNGAGFNTSNKYGFGRPNMAAALNLARTWKPVAAEEITTATINPNVAIPDNDPAGVEASINITEGFETEWAQIDLQLTHPSRGELEIALISPSGTVSILADPHNDTNPDFNWRLISPQFWGERSNGTWRIRVRDLSGTAGGGTLQQVRLTIIGTKGAPPSFGNGGFLDIIPSPAPEGSAVVLSGRFTDPDGLAERHTVRINWGDGTPVQDVPLFIGQQTFNVQHKFRDNGSFAVSATVIDERNNAGPPGSITALVSNVAPTAKILGAPLTALEGQTLNFFAAAADPGILDTFTYNWSVTKNGVAYNPGTPTDQQAFSFAPDDAGIFRVNLTITDDDGGIGIAPQAKITVANTAPTGNFVNDGPKASAADPITFTFTPVDGAADVASMKYSIDFDNDGDFTSPATATFPADILNGTSPTVTVNFGNNGIFEVRGRMTDKEGLFTDFTTFVVIGVPAFYNPTTRYYVAGPGVGTQPRVKVFNLDNTIKYDILAYASGFQGGVRVATGDVDGDGTEDIITAPGAGGGPHIKIFSGATGNLLKEFLAPLTNYTAGLNVAAGDLNSDGKADIILGTSIGKVIVIDGASPTNAVFGTFNFQPFAGFNGVINVASGDYNGDRVMDLVVGRGPGGPPEVRIYRTDFAGGTGNPLLMKNFMAFESTMLGGVSVAIGDVNGDGRGDIIVGSGAKPGYQTRVKVFNGKNTAQTIWSFATFPGYTGGVQVGAKDLDGDGKADILVSTNSGIPNRLMALKGTNLKKLAFFMPYDMNFLGGVFVG